MGRGRDISSRTRVVVAVSRRMTRRRRRCRLPGAVSLLSVRSVEWLIDQVVDRQPLTWHRRCSGMRAGWFGGLVIVLSLLFDRADRTDRCASSADC